MVCRSLEGGQPSATGGPTGEVQDVVGGKHKFGADGMDQLAVAAHRGDVLPAQVPQACRQVAVSGVATSGD